MTRFTIVHTESSCGWGGQELRIIDESEGFLENGHDVSIVAPPQSRVIAEARRRSVPVVALPIDRRSVSGLLALRRFLAARPVNIVNTHSSTDSWLAALSTRMLKSPPKLVRTRHVSAPIPRNWPSRWLYRSAAAHVVTTGAALRTQVIQQTGLAESRVTSVPTGIDLERFCPGDRGVARALLGIPSEDFLIGIVATLRSWKGHRFLIEAFAALGDTSCRLAIVGDGPGAENLRRQIADLGIEDRVMMPGNQSDVLPWLHSMDIFVLPSYKNEGVPQAIMQAQACGIPVISTAVGSIGEIVADNETGLMVAPQDKNSLRVAIEALKGNAALRTRLSEAACKQARARYSAATMIDRMRDVFLDVMACPD